MEKTGITKHRGKFSQVFIYLGKLFRMFVFQNDWKILPMSAIISGLVSFVVGANLFKTQEGTLMGTTTTAMTIMPFLLIFQLVFSCAFFQLNGNMVNRIKETTISKWGLTALCSQGDYNSLPMVALWNAVSKFQDVDVADYLISMENYAASDEEMIRVDDLKFDTAPKKELKPIRDFMVYAQKSGAKDEILDWSGRNNQNPDYAHEKDIVLKCWGRLILFVIIYACVAVISLEFIDKDKR